ncbi:uncharacterized membrane protein YheB (UPF0754 family) [Pullulanibacillus pueri]|uniref:UPF0754 membrane protein n=1 Tax=Pullulanibacillus pueri TaxID=1437324 RepID=A0A8J3EP92_9BACL|nr:DUF445 family protein [Pullulanibacillus pueri]MBM7683409.1 uncharacterized membrane protein YheB (UPF0754 family) [Pullulanibacillus pueri]GGH88042.1 UPF0754 membrane protein [Pullulanibacillus pueri]
MSVGEVLGTFVLLVVIGAIIGGVTNSIAIKMLFRPHRPVYIGKWRLPFTPGVIPKRREEIAGQLGKLVMKHLLTADSLEKKFADSQLQERTTSIIQGELEKWLDEKKPFRSYIKNEEQRERLISHVNTMIDDWVMGSFDSLWEDNKDKTVREIIPEGMKPLIESQLPEFSRYIGQQLTDYLESEKGRETVKDHLDRFFENKGFLGNMLGMFLGNQSLVDKLYPEMISFLRQPSFIMALHELLETEWFKIQDLTLLEIDEKWQAEGTLRDFVHERVVPRLSVTRLLEKSPSEVLSGLKAPLLEEVPVLVEYGLRTLSGRITEILQVLDLEKLITDQVRAFSLQELEEVVLLISKREFKMITYLGALLGGIIGVFQAIIMLFIQ